MSPPEKAEGPAADRTPRTATNVNHIDDSTPGLWRLAIMGRARPVPREPDTTHYGCGCCRWSA